MANAEYLKRLSHSDDPRASKVAFWLNDDAVNELVVKTQSKDKETAREALNKLDDLLGTICEIYATPFSYRLEDSIHAGAEVNDLANEMFIAYRKALPTIARKESPKRYLVIVIKNRGRQFAIVENDLLGAYARVSSKGRPGVMKALNGEIDETNYNLTCITIAANKHTEYLDNRDVLNSSYDYMSGHIGETNAEMVEDEHASEAIDTAECRAAMNQAINKIDDPIMRIVVSACMNCGLKDDALCGKEKRALAAKYCLEKYGIDQELFSDAYKKGMICLEHYMREGV